MKRCPACQEDRACDQVPHLRHPHGKGPGYFYVCLVCGVVFVDWTVQRQSNEADR